VRTGLFRKCPSGRAHRAGTESKRTGTAAGEVCLVGESGIVCCLRQRSAFHDQSSSLTQTKRAQILANTAALRAPEDPGEVDGVHAGLYRHVPQADGITESRVQKILGCAEPPG